MGTGQAANQVQPLPPWPDDLRDEAGAAQAVGFHTQIAYCREADGEATVYLVRTGPAAGVVEATITVGTAKHTWGHAIAFRSTSVAFGDGEHCCIGSHMARRVLRAGLELLLRRFPGMAPMPERTARIVHGTQRGPRTFWVTLGEARGASSV